MVKKKIEEKIDKRYCPDCHTRMDSKGSMADFNDDSGNYCLYQCPKCKNVEILWEGPLREGGEIGEP